MATLLVPPSTDEDFSSSLNDSNGTGGGGGTGIPHETDHHTAELEPSGRATPASAYCLITVLAIIWIAALFGTLAIVLEARWVHSASWFSIPLPRIMYVNTAVLLLSSVSMELARRSLRVRDYKRSVGWILVTLWMGLLFLTGQGFAWEELSLRGLHLASNPGSFFLYLMTGTQGVHVLVGMALLASLGFGIRRSTQTPTRQAAMDSVALYWNFLDGLWLCLLALLFATIQR